MGKLVVVGNDKVEGTDKHTVTGNATNPSAPPPTVPYTGIGSFDYSGKMTDQLSDFIKIDGHPIALINSKSSLNPGEDASPTGKHSGPMGTDFKPPTPKPIAPSLSITDSIGTGIPNAAAGSSFVKVDGHNILLDGDFIDTCDGLGIPKNSSVTAQQQDFVSCAG